MIPPGNSISDILIEAIYLDFQQKSTHEFICHNSLCMKTLMENPEIMKEQSELT